VKIALVGNPNVGKSVIFNALTGSYATVSNYPGTTVEVAKGVWRFGGHVANIIDTPGVNSLNALSEDEKVTCDILRSDIGCIVHVADSKNLKRSLLLTLELAKLGIPLVLCLNMADEARERGIEIDARKLAERLGIEVVETVAVTGEGVSRLKDAIRKARLPHVAIDIIPGKHETVKPQEMMSLVKRTRVAENIAKSVLSVSGNLKASIAEKIGSLTIKPVTGIPILIGVLVFMYFFVGRFAAGTLVDILQEGFFGKWVNPFFIDIADKYIRSNMLKDFLVGDYGIITMAVTYAFAIILPIVTAFFLFFGVLEDSGYLPRLSVLSDRVFKVIGLNGRAILPVILGLGCGTMATLTTRILDTKKERIVVTLLLALTIPCSAQLGVIMGLLGSISLKATILWVLVLLSVLISVGFAASKIVPGERSPFIQELAPIRMPKISNIIVKTFARLKWYLKEAVPLFLLGTTVLFVLDKLWILRWLEKALSPLVVHFLGLPEKITSVFILGFLRRDYGAAGLYAFSKSGALNNIQILVSLVVITLFVPCIAQFFVTVKERGVKVALIIGVFVFLFAILAGGALNFALKHLVEMGVAII
jgi:ferrous iron transport protein B